MLKDSLTERRSGLTRDKVDSLLGDQKVNLGLPSARSPPAQDNSRTLSERKSGKSYNFDSESKGIKESLNQPSPYYNAGVGGQANDLYVPLGIQKILQKQQH